jgi:hypothetical protein
MKKLAFIILIIVPYTNVFAQGLPKQIINKIFNDTSSTEKAKSIAYPMITYAPETNWKFGVATLILFKAKKDTTNRFSEIKGQTFFTSEKQYGLKFNHAIYTDKNKWFFLGTSIAQSYPLVYYGIGSDISGEKLAKANANFVLLRERLLRNFYGNWFIGLELDYEKLSKVSFEWRDEQAINVAPKGINGYNNIGIGVGIVYDTRHNVLNVRQGFMYELGYLLYRNQWGSTNNLNTIFLDTRAFYKVKTNTVLAGQVLGQFSQGDVPFNQLSMAGGDMMLRGHYLGKYRDTNMLSVQVEYRCLPFSYSKRIGGTLFAAAGSVAPDLGFDKLILSAGAGLRLLLFPKQDIFIRGDLGLTNDGYGIYLFIGEAF